MKNFSKNKKLNNVLNDIYNQLNELGINEIKRYYNDFSYENDYNLAQYGNLLIYHWQVRELYKDYKSLANTNDSKLWEIYKRQVGYVARLMLNGVV